MLSWGYPHRWGVLFLISWARSRKFDHTFCSKITDMCGSLLLPLKGASISQKLGLLAQDFKVITQVWVIFSGVCQKSELWEFWLMGGKKVFRCGNKLPQMCLMDKREDTFVELRRVHSSCVSHLCYLSKSINATTKDTSVHPHSSLLALHFCLLLMRFDW